MGSFEHHHSMVENKMAAATNNTLQSMMRIAYSKVQKRTFFHNLLVLKRLRVSPGSRSPPDSSPRRLARVLLLTRKFRTLTLSSPFYFVTSWTRPFHWAIIAQIHVQSWTSYSQIQCYRMRAILQHQFMPGSSLSTIAEPESWTRPFHCIIS